MTRNQTGECPGRGVLAAVSGTNRRFTASYMSLKSAARQLATEHLAILSRHVLTKRLAIGGHHLSLHSASNYDTFPGRPRYRREYAHSHRRGESTRPCYREQRRRRQPIRVIAPVPGRQNLAWPRRSSRGSRAPSHLALRRAAGASGQAWSARNPHEGEWSGTSCV